MSSKFGSNIPILEKDLAPHRKDVGSLIGLVNWTPTAQLTLATNGDKGFAPGTKTWRASGVANPVAQELSLIKIGRALSQDQNLMTEPANFVLLTLQQALCLGFHLGQQYCKAAGVLELQKLNASRQLTMAQKEEFQSKMNTASAVTLFTTAAYLVWRLGAYQEV